MFSLDPRSLIAMGAFMALVMGIVLGVMRRYYPPNIHGLGHWALSPVFMLCGALLYVLPVPWPPELGRWLGHSLVLFGFVLLHCGSRRFFNLDTRPRILLFMYVLVLLALGWFGMVKPSYRAQVITFNTALIALHLLTLRFLAQAGNRNFPIRMVQATLVLHIAVLVVRLQVAFRAQPGGDMMEPTLLQTLYLSAFVVIGLLLLIGAVLMATERVRTELEYLATHDALAGTLNRRAILSACEDELERSQRYGQPFSLLMIDLDHFKAVNDSFGHLHGDKVLAHFAEQARAALRRADRLGRYGGEEFLILLPNTTADAASTVAQRIHAALARGHALDCKVSIGVATWWGAEDSLDAMLTRADDALYSAKAKGRNQTCAS